jgi:hypothetical protein
MRFTLCIVFLLLCCTFASAQSISNTKGYSETTSNGITIQNSFPKGGRYEGTGGKNAHYSYLIFFTRIVNETATPVELNLSFAADSFVIPDSPSVFMKLFLPPDTMTHDKERLYSYGLKSLESFLDFTKPTMLKRTINPNEEFIFYVGTVFYQEKGTTWGNQSRGGTRAELVLKGQDLFYNMKPQVDSLPCGSFTPIK